MISLASENYFQITFYLPLFRMIPDSVQFGTDAPVKIANITRHYRFKPHLDYHNLALIKLEPPGVNVQPACLWMEDKFDYANFDVIGRDETESPISTSVQHLSVEKCHEYYDLNTKLRFGVIHNQICTINEESRKCPVSTKHFWKLIFTKRIFLTNRQISEAHCKELLSSRTNPSLSSLD